MKSWWVTAIDKVTGRCLVAKRVQARSADAAIAKVQYQLDLIAHWHAVEWE